MTEDVLDEATEAAVRELADQLSATLSDALEEAASRALGRVEQEIELRVNQIDGATSRVVDLLDSVGLEMKTRAVTALAEGIRTEVQPVLARDEEKFRGAIGEMSQRVVERTEHTDRAIQKVLFDTRSEVLHAVDSIARKVTEAHKKSTADAARTEVELRERTDAIAKRIAEAHEKSAADAKRIGVELRERTDAIAKQVAEAHEKSAADAKRIGGDLRDRSDAIALHLEARIRKLHQFVIAVTVAAGLTLLLLIVHLV